MNAVSKNVYIDKLPESAKQYKSTIHRSIKLKSTDVKLDTFINFGVKFNIRKPNLMLVLMQKFQSTKSYFQTIINQIGQKKCF